MRINNTIPNLQQRIIETKNNSQQFLELPDTVERKAPVSSGQLFIGEDIVASEWISSGLTFYLKYDEESTEENPCMLATGIDELGNQFEKKIYINDITPRNATYIEMVALEAHLNGGKSGSSVDSLTFNNIDAGLNDRIDFIDKYQTYALQLAQARWPGYEKFNQNMAEFERRMFEQFNRKYECDK